MKPLFNQSGKTSRLLFAILFVSAMLKLITCGVIFSANPQSVVTSDSELYDNSALALLTTGSFSIAPDNPVPQTIVQPGYSLFLAAVYAIVGKNFIGVVIFQILISLVSIWLTYSIASRLWGENTGLLAALLLSLDVNTFSHVLMILTETLFTLLFLLLLACGVNLLSNESKVAKWAFLLGLFLGLATLVRPISYYLIVPLLFGLVIYYLIQRRPWKTTLFISSMMLLPYLVLIGGWMLRNYLLTGNASYNQLAGMNMLFYKGAGVLALRDDIDLYDAQKKYFGMTIYEATELAILHPEQKLSEKWQKEAIQVFKENPIYLLRMQGSSMFVIMVGAGEMNLLKLTGYPIEKTGPLGDLLRLSMSEYVQSWLIERPLAFVAFIFANLYLGIIYLANLYWIGTQVRRREWNIIHLFLWGALLYFLILSAGPEGYYRFRVPVTPILAMYAAEGLRLFFMRWHPSRLAQPQIH